MSTTFLACNYDVENINLLAEFGNEAGRRIRAENPNGSTFELAGLLMKEFEAWKAIRGQKFRDQVNSVGVDSDGVDSDGVDSDDVDSDGVDSDDVDSDDVDSEDEDEAGGEIGKLGDENKTGTVKRPQAPMEGELECKKPRIDEGSACQGEE